MKWALGIVIVVIATIALTGKYVERQLTPPENYGWQPPTEEETIDTYGDIESRRLGHIAPHLFEAGK